MEKTRADFFANGLVPFKLPKDQKPDNCSICLSELSDAVKTPCGHIFDKECLEMWLNQETRCACPLCKHKLFTPHPEEDLEFDDVNPDALVAEAIRHAGLTEPEPVYHSFSIPSVDGDRLRQATALAGHWLAMEDYPVPGELIQNNDTGDIAEFSGNVTIDAHRHFAELITAIGNIIPCLAAVEGRRYTEDQARDWDLVVSALWGVLRANNGDVVPIARLRCLMYCGVKGRILCENPEVVNPERLAPFALPGNVDVPGDVDGGPAKDYILLVNFLLLMAWQNEHLVEERQRQERLERRAERRAVRAAARQVLLERATCAVM